MIKTAIEILKDKIFLKSYRSMECDLHAYPRPIGGVAEQLS
jgi:hypothetical protein